MRNTINLVSSTPSTLYHHAPERERESIMTHGLLRSKSETAELAREMGDSDWHEAGGIFFSNRISEREHGIDVWEVDVRGLNLVRDETTDHDHLDEEWWVDWVDPIIPPSRLNLLADRIDETKRIVSPTIKAEKFWINAKGEYLDLGKFNHHLDYLTYHHMSWGNTFDLGWVRGFFENGNLGFDFDKRKINPKILRTIIKLIREKSPSSIIWDDTRSGALYDSKRVSPEEFIRDMRALFPTTLTEGWFGPALLWRDKMNQWFDVQPFNSLCDWDASLLSSSSVWIENIEVHDPADRGAGYGREILKHMCKLADQYRVTLALHASAKDRKTPDLKEWYSRYGFEPSDDVPNDEGLVRIPQRLSENVRYYSGFKRPPTRDETNRYMRGWCPYFALALHDIYEYPLVTSGEHFAVKVGDKFVDIRGIMTENQFNDGINNSATIITREELISDLENGTYKCGFFSENDLKKAKHLVRNLSPDFKQSITEMPISDINHIGNWDKGSSFRNQQDRKLLTNPKAIQKIKAMWKFPEEVNYNIMLVNHKNGIGNSEVGLVDNVWLAEYMPDIADELMNLIKPDSVNIIYTNNDGAQRVPMTGWTLAHRFGHALNTSRFGKESSYYFTEAAQTLSRYLNDLATDYGIVPNGIGYGDRKLNAILARNTINLLHEICTFRSARERNLRTSYEALYELFAQYIIRGSIKFNHIPETVKVGRSTYRYRHDKDDFEASNQTIRDDLSYELEQFFATAIHYSVGKILVM